MTPLPGQCLKCRPAVVGLLMLTLLGCAPRSQPAARGVARASAAAVFASLEANRAAAQAEPLAELYGITDTDLSCQQAQRLAYRTVERMGYRVTSATRAAPGKTGTIQAQQTRSGQTALVQVRVQCQPQSVVVDAASLSSLDVASPTPHPLVTDYPEQAAPHLTKQRPPPTTYFRRAFYSLFHGLAAHVKRYGPEGQIYVDIRPLPAMEAELLFGVHTPEIFIVAVEVANRTQQTYVFDTEQVYLLSVRGRAVRALTEKDAASLPPPMVSQALAAQVATHGYLYYPAGEYLSAQGTLTEVHSQERQGFQIAF